MKRLNLSEKYEKLQNVLEVMIDNQYKNEDDYEMTVIEVSGFVYIEYTLCIHLIDRITNNTVMFQLRDSGNNHDGGEKVEVTTNRRDKVLKSDLCYFDDTLVSEIKKINRIIFNQEKAIFLESTFAFEFLKNLLGKYIYKYDENKDKYRLVDQNTKYKYDKDENELKIHLQYLNEDTQERLSSYIIIKINDDGQTHLTYMDMNKKKKDVINISEDALCQLIKSYTQY